MCYRFEFCVIDILCSEQSQQNTNKQQNYGKNLKHDEVISVFNPAPPNDVQGDYSSEDKQMENEEYSI